MKKEEVTILVTGDFCPINRLEELTLAENYDKIINDFSDVFKDNDISVVDLECPLTESKKSRLKSGPHQRAKPDSIKILQNINITHAALANNHIMDYDTEGIEETLRICEDHSINVLGVGRNPEEASKPSSIQVKSKRIAILNYADNEFITTSNSSYVCNPLEAINVFYDIQKVKQHHDFLLVIVHAGNEFYELPSPRTKMLYRYIVDAGADAIISHHTHSYSGYEVYKSKPIFYGLGNFLYDWPGKVNSSWNRGYVVKLFINESINFRIIPFKQCNEKPGLFHLDKEDTDSFVENINRLNNIINNDSELEKEFGKYCKSVYPMYDAFIEPYFGRIVTSLRKRGLFPKLVSGRKRILLLNLMRCESHREVLVKMLNKTE